RPGFRDHRARLPAGRRPTGSRRAVFVGLGRSLPGSGSKIGRVRAEPERIPRVSMSLMMSLLPARLRRVLGACAVVLPMLAGLSILTGFAGSVAAADGPVRVETVEVELVAERSAISAGQPLSIGLRIAHDP